MFMVYMTLIVLIQITDNYYYKIAPLRLKVFFMKVTCCVKSELCSLDEPFF